MKKFHGEQGFSLIELIAVVAVVCILTAIAFISMASTRKYDADDQAEAIVDVLNQAHQYSLSQRRNFRVEINKTKKKITLINENDKSGDASDDVIVKSVPFKNNVIINEVPSNIVDKPTYTSPIPVLEFVSSTYPLSSGEEKITLRFSRNGRVLDTGSDNIGTGSIMRGALIYVYTNKRGTTTPEIIRAITVAQTSGNTAILRCSFDSTGKCGNWKR